MENFYNVITYLSSRALDVNFTGQSLAVGAFDHIAIQYVVSNSSSLSGNLQLQKSLDGSSWVNLGSVIPLSGDTVAIVTESDIKYGYIRATYTASAGDGLLGVKVATINDTSN